MVDKGLVKHRLAMIADYCIELEKLRQLPKGEFLDKRNAAAAESFLRRSLEAVFDIGRHLLARSGGYDLAKEYKSIAKGLGEKGIIDHRLSETLVKMAGYRNRLVHLYHQVSEEELYSIVQSDLADIKDFLKQVTDYLRKT